VNGLIRRYRSLHARGFPGLNLRNAAYVLPGNPREAYPRVDDKLLTKRLAASAALPTPRLLGVIRYHHELHDLPSTLAGLDEFVVEPGQGRGCHADGIGRSPRSLKPLDGAAGAGRADADGYAGVAGGEVFDQGALSGVEAHVRCEPSGDRFEVFLVASTPTLPELAGD